MNELKTIAYRTETRSVAETLSNANICLLWANDGKRSVKFCYIFGLWNTQVL